MRHLVSHEWRRSWQIGFTSPIRRAVSSRVTTLHDRDGMLTVGDLRSEVDTGGVDTVCW